MSSLCVVEFDGTGMELVLALRVKSAPGSVAGTSRCLRRWFWLHQGQSSTRTTVAVLGQVDASLGLDILRLPRGNFEILAHGP